MGCPIGTSRKHSIPANMLEISAAYTHLSFDLIVSVLCQRTRPLGESRGNHSSQILITCDIPSTTGIINVMVVYALQREKERELARSRACAR